MFIKREAYKNVLLIVKQQKQNCLHLIKKYFCLQAKGLYGALQIFISLSLSQISESLSKSLNSNEIVFCGNVQASFLKFLETKHLLVLIDSGISKIENYVKINLAFLNAQESLILQFVQKVSNEEEYNHQFQELSVRFLLINQKLQQNYLGSEELLNSEIGKLISQDLLQTFLQSVKRKEALKIEKTTQKFSNFEKLIYYYTRDDKPNSFYKMLNQKLAQAKYDELEQIMCTLFNGYSNLKYQGLTKKKLYRGISFGQSEKLIYDQIINELTQCQKNKKSIFWNSLTSTTMKKSATNYFLKLQFKILFEISLDQVNPHPYFRLEEYHSEIPSEEEVILFPQFEFQVLSINQDGQTYTIMIKQVENNLSMTLDSKKRQQYWENRINDDIKPKLRTIASFYQIRINYIMKTIRQFSIGDEYIRKCLKTNSDDFFFKLVSQLQTFCDNQKFYQDYLAQLLTIVQNEFSFQNNITDEFLQESKKLFQKSSEQIINEFILLIKKIYNLEEFKYNINRLVQSTIQKAEIKRNQNDLYQILALSNQLDEFIFSAIIEILRNSKILDCVKFLEQEDNQKHIKQYILQVKNNLTLVDKQQKIGDLEKTIQKFTNIIKLIKVHDFNKTSYLIENYEKNKQNLTNKISQDQIIISFLKFLVRLTAIDNQFIQSGSNSLHLLVAMKVDLTKSSLEGIKIRNTSLIGSNFVRCNLSESEFDNVDIRGMNLNGAKLFNCKWKNIKMNELRIFEGHTSNVQSVCFSPNGTTLASGSDDNSIHLWDVQTGQKKSKLDGHTNDVRSVCFSPDGTMLASGSDDKSIRLWDVKTGQQKFELDGHSHYVMSVCFSPDGNTLASGSGDKTIRLWDVKTGQQKSKLDGHSSCVNSVCFSPDGNTLASGSSDKSIRLWDVKTGQYKSKLDGHTDLVTKVCFSPDGNTLASGSNDKSINLWDVKSGQQKSKLNGHQSSVISVCFSPDGITLASGSNDNTIRLWDVKTGQQKFKLDGHSNYVMSVCFSPNGTTLASGSNDKSIRLWDVKTGQQKSTLDGHSHNVMSVCFSPDGTTLASGSGDNSIRLWDVKTGQQKFKLDGHTSWVLSVCFSPDDTTLATSSGDNSIRLWDVKTGQSKSKLVGHTNWVMSVCFTPDGNTLASGSSDNSIRLWDVSKGKEIQSSDKSSKDILAQFKNPLFQNNPLPEISTNITIVLISQTPIFQAQGALVYQGEFINYQGVDLRSLFKSKGSYIFDKKLQK